MNNTPSKKAMQLIVMAYFNAFDTIESMTYLGDEEVVKARSIIRILTEFEAEAMAVMEEYALESPASRWATSVIPIPLAAGYGCGIHLNGGRIIESPSRLFTFCGMEAKKYLSPGEVKRIMVKITRRSGGSISQDEIQKIAEASGRTYDPTANLQSWDDAYLFFTRKNHSEFLRTVSIRLGKWISERDNNYKKIYVDAMRNESLKNAPPSMEQTEHRSRNAAVRAFLTDYYKRLPNKVRGK
jgi:hypothetical protein